MATKQKPVANISAAIREAIGRVPDEQLLRAKPADVLPVLQQRGVEISASVKSMTSRLLSAAKGKRRFADLTSPRPDPTSDDRMEAALTFVKACGGLKAAKRALQIFEEIARMTAADG